MTEILTLKWDIGYHVQFSSNIYNSAYLAISMGLTSMQFFMGNPRSYNRHKASKSDIKKTIKLCKRFPINIFSHFPYIANLAGSRDILAWKGNAEQDEKTMKVIKQLEYELGIIAQFSSSNKNVVGGVVIHPGNHKDRKKGLNAIAQSINKINFISPHCKLLLENSAGQGHTLATTFEELRDIYDKIDDEKKDNIGFCIDTAHIFGYGLYDLSDSDQIKKLFSDFDRLIGLDKFSLLHLNDSKVPLGSRKDRHQTLGDGYIWEEDLSSLFVLLDLCKLHNIPIILETESIDIPKLGRLGKYKTFD